MMAGWPCAVDLRWPLALDSQTPDESVHNLSRSSYIELQRTDPGVQVSDESTSEYQRRGEPPRVVTDPGVSVHRAPAAAPAHTDGLNSSATRYLSAGAYLDPKFRDQALE